MIEAIIADTETTDKEGDIEVLELAWACWKSTASHRALYEPSTPIRWGAMAVHNILPQDVLGQGHKPSRDAYKDLPVGLRYLIGHNIDFDWKALGCPPVNRICTLAMSRALWPECDSHTLSAMTYFIQGANPATRDKLRSAHSADADVALCAELLAVILSVAKITTLEALYEFSEDARVPKIMTFGKFRGMPVSAVDRGYSNWYRKQPDTDPYLLEAFRRAGI